MNVPLPPDDPAALLLSRQYRVLLVLAALIGLVVSAASWCFLEGVHELQVWVYKDLPGRTSATTPCRSGGRFRGWRSPGC